MLGRGHRTRDTARMAEIIEAEHSDNHGSHTKPRTSCKRRGKLKKTKKDYTSDLGDENFSASDGELSDETGNDSDLLEITNEEVSIAFLFLYIS